MNAYSPTPRGKDRRLLEMAQKVSLMPQRGRAVFYFADGANVAERFVRQNPFHTRIDELMQKTEVGRILWRDLTRERYWPAVEASWQMISVRMAEAASGDVHCFGPERDLLPSGSAAPFRSRFDPRAYVDEIFWKIEVPALEVNPEVDRIFFNGVPL